MRKIINSFVEKISLKKAVIATVVFGFMLWLIDYSPIGVSGLLRITGGPSILDFESGYSVDEGYAMLEALGEAGRHFHLTKIMPLDIFFPLSLMVCNFSWICYFLKKLTKEGNMLRLLPILSIVNMLLDWTENIGITTMLLNYPDRLAGVCRFTSIVSSIKMTCVAVIFGTIFIMIVVLVVKRINAIMQCTGRRYTH